MTVSDADRERVIAALREQAAEGRLDMDEYGQRLDEAYQAVTMDDLRHALRELPVVMPGPTATAPPPRQQGPRPRPSPRPPRAPRAPAEVARVRAAAADAAWAAHRNTYIAVIGFLVMIWLVTGAGFPWPIFPAGGWGIGLVAHGSAHHAAKSRRPPL
jgi:Domain of unknown function (DUF1707)/2TM domain